MDNNQNNYNNQSNDSNGQFDPNGASNNPYGAAGNGQFNQSNQQFNQNNGQYSWGNPNQQNGGWQYTNGQFYGQMPPINNAPHANKEASSAQTLGIVGLVMSVVCCALVGIILGILAISRASSAKNLLGYETSEAKTGRICGIIAIVLGVLSMIGSVIINVVFSELVAEAMGTMQAFFTLFF